ncbi:universal stress protein [Variovorax sp. LT1P1]|uniref:universal stress protein n=1 Tax=Variovorax sp. LT1P1 TaxID=3443730 RepID=UPI003F4705D8
MAGEGQPGDVLPDDIAQADASLLVMGAYGHSRIRQLVVGCTTTMLLRVSTVPVLILR